MIGPLETEHQVFGPDFKTDRQRNLENAEKAAAEALAVEPTPIGGAQEGFVFPEGSVVGNTEEKE